jgi:hypothetical protein
MTQSYAASRKKSSILYVVYQILLFSGCNNFKLARRPLSRDGWRARRSLCFFSGWQTVLVGRFLGRKTTVEGCFKKTRLPFPCAYAARSTLQPIPPLNQCAHMVRHAVTCGVLPLVIGASRFAQRS